MQGGSQIYQFWTYRKAMSWKWCKIGSKLVLITNRKSYMSFQLVPKLVTLNGIMTLILHYFTEFSSFRGALRKSDWRCCRKKLHVCYLVSLWVCCRCLQIALMRAVVVYSRAWSLCLSWWMWTRWRTWSSSVRWRLVIAFVVYVRNENKNP